MHDPIAQFAEWFAAARACPDIADASAMVLATATPEGRPAARVVLLKDHGVDGFVFYGNMESRKFSELKANPFAALCFYWSPLGRQIRIEGATVPVSAAEADAYFATRNREKQIGAWASQQSRPMARAQDLQDRFAQFEEQFKGGDVSRPPHWSGWRLTPERLEFWSQGDFRLHVRDVYLRSKSGWEHQLLYP